MSKYPSVDLGHQYAIDIVNKKILACEYIIKACKYYLDSLRQVENNEDYPFYFDKQKAELVLKFKQAMPHTKGKWARDRLLLTLEPWQCFMNMNIFGWMRKDTDKRRYRVAILFVPRKNGKSAEAATTGLYMLAADNEYGAEVYSGAANERQAKEVFTPAQIMTKKDSDFREFYGVQSNASNIVIAENGSKFEPLIGNPNDGASPSCAIVDEYHEHQNDNLFETMQTGMGSREQPLILVITTAGDNISGPCYQMISDAQKMLDGVYDDDQTFAMIFTIDKGDDWKSEEALIKANPNFDVSISGDFLRSQQKNAINSARKQSAFQTKHLNIWVGSRSAYFNLEKWNNCSDSKLDIVDYFGKTAYLGLDLASKVDIAALVIIIPVGENEYVMFNKSYLPEETILNGNDAYQQWAIDGWLTETDGQLIDFNVIQDDILDLCKNFVVEEVAYDPFQATMLATSLMAKNVPVVELGATVINFSEPMKQIEALTRTGGIKHNGDPCFTWMMSNVVSKTDRKDNEYPNKEKPENKIDGPVAMMMAMNRAMNHVYMDIDDFINNMVSIDQ
jgi:phage terminase large subunit-like protein